jgi:hypothetical protein
MKKKRKVEKIEHRRSCFDYKEPAKKEQKMTLVIDTAICKIHAHPSTLVFIVLKPSGSGQSSK